MSCALLCVSPDHQPTFLPPSPSARPKLLWSAYALVGEARDYMVENLLGLGDLDASFKWQTKSSNSFCRWYLVARAFFCSSGLYLCDE